MQTEETIHPNGDAELLPQSADDNTQTATDAPVLYDATADQLVPVEVEGEEGTVEVRLRTFPPTNSLVRKYAKARVSTDDAADDFAVKADAAEKFFPQFIREPEGIEDLPADWMDSFGAQDKLAIISTLLLCERVYQPITKATQLKKWRVAVTSTVRLRCYFNGAFVETSHTFRKATAVLYADFMRGAHGGADELEQLDALAKVYDKLHVSHEHYAGDVPDFHKSAAIRIHLERIANATRKN
jgi:hypothetical protein